MNKKTIGIVALVVVVCVGVFALINKNPEEKTVVRIGYANVLGSLPVFVAKENKYFEELGLQPEFVAVTTGNQLVEGLVRGDLDVVPFSAVVPLLNVELSDPGKVDLFSLGSMTADEPFDSVVVKNESQITSVSDLAGKKIGVFPGSTATAFIKKYLTLKGVDTSAIEFVQIPPQNHITALEAGSVDALYAYEPTLTIALEVAGARRIVGSIYADLSANTPVAAGMIRAELVATDNKTAEKIVKAIDRANAFINANENDKKVREIAMKSFNLQQEVADAVSLPYMGVSDEVDTSAFAEFVNLLVTIGELKASPDLSTMFYK